MKKIFLFISIVTFIIKPPLLAQKDYRTLYERKIVSYTKMKNTGTTLGVAGAGATALGIVLLSNVNWESDSDYNNDDDIDALKIMGGINLIIYGNAVAAAGIVLGSVGSAKSKEYQRKLDNLSIGINYTPQQKGISLTYKF